MVEPTATDPRERETELGPDDTPAAAPEEESSGPVIRDRRRIDPETGRVREPEPRQGGEDAAAGTDGESDPRFTAADGNLLNGLFRYRTADGRIGYKTTDYDAFATEQAFRALIVYRELRAEGGTPSPYVFSDTPVTLETGVVLPGGEPVADTGEAEVWHNAIGATLLSTALAAVLTLPSLRRRTEEK